MKKEKIEPIVEKEGNEEKNQEEQDEEDFFSKEEQEKVKARLRAQGYID